jgi:hypothetical protein
MTDRYALHSALTVFQWLCAYPVCGNGGADGARTLHLPIPERTRMRDTRCSFLNSNMAIALSNRPWNAHPCERGPIRERCRLSVRIGDRRENWVFA